MKIFLTRLSQGDITRLGSAPAGPPETCYYCGRSKNALHLYIIDRERSTKRFDSAAMQLPLYEQLLRTEEISGQEVGIYVMFCTDCLLCRGADGDKKINYSNLYIKERKE